MSGAIERLALDEASTVGFGFKSQLCCVTLGKLPSLSEPLREVFFPLCFYFSRNSGLSSKIICVHIFQTLLKDKSARNVVEARKIFVPLKSHPRGLPTCLPLEPDCFISFLSPGL